MPFQLNGTMDPNDPQNQPQANFQLPGYAGYAANPANLFKVAPAVMTSPNQPTPFAAPQQQKPPSLFSSAPNPVAGPGGVGLPGGPHLSDVLKGPVQNYQDWAAANPSQLAQPIQANHPKLTMLTAALEGLSGAILQHNPAAGVDFANSIRQHDEAVPQINQQRYQQQVVQPYQQALTNQKNISDIAHTEAETSAIPENQALKRLGIESQAGSHGLKLTQDEQGNYSLTPDEESPVYQKQLAAIQAVQAQIAERNAQAQLAQARTAGMDPNSPQFQLLVKNEQDRRVEAGAAVTRAQAYMGNYLERAYNVGMNGQTLPGAPQIADENGNITTPGTGNASTAIHSQANVAQFKDVYGALDSADNAAKALVGSGGKLNSPAVIQAFKVPSGSLGQYLQSQLVNKQLTPQERDYVLAVRAAHENVQALRKSAGGTATDSSVAKLDALIPGENTPDLDFFLRQTQQIRNTANRLGTGVTTAKGGLSRPGGALGPNPPKVRKYNPSTGNFE